MPCNFAVKSEVVDLTRITPRADQSFLVDTNIWFWAVYPSAPDAPQTPRDYQLQDYPQFLKAVLLAKGKLFWSALSWPELTHAIEATEFKAAKAYGGIPDATGPKEYRHNFPEERARVAQAVNGAWDQVRSFAEPLAPFTVGADSVERARGQMTQEKLDGYDLFLVQALRAAGVSGVVTDDGDFCTCPGIRVYTANRAVIGAARRQNCLINR